MEATIAVGQLEVRFLIDGDDVKGSLSVFECRVPAGAKIPAPHSHVDFEETIYGLQGVSTWTIDGKRIEIGPGEAVYIERGSTHGFANHADRDAKFLAIATPGVFGPAYFKEIGALLAAAGGALDSQALFEVMRRHGLTPAAPIGV